LVDKTEKTAGLKPDVFYLLNIFYRTFISFVHTLIWVIKTMKIIKTLCNLKNIISRSETGIREVWVRRILGKGFKRNNPKIKDTKEIYSVKGYKYSQKRHAMHMNIVNKMIKQAPSPKKGEKSIAILIGGGTASGKTIMRKSVIEKKLAEIGIQAVIVDPDEIKEYIPEYKLLQKTHPNDAARLVHKESLDISDLLLKQLIHHRKHFIYEGTMARTRKYKNLIKKLKRARYEVHVYIVDVPLELAKQRADERAKVTGRKIPPHIIENTHKLVSKTFEAIKDLVDSYYVYDNRDRLKLIASKNYIEPALYNEFLKKGKAK
jgi:predicted ABC-type ATPase